MNSFSENTRAGRQLRNHGDSCATRLAKTVKPAAINVEFTKRKRCVDLPCQRSTLRLYLLAVRFFFDLLDDLGLLLTFDTPSRKWHGFQPLRTDLACAVSARAICPVLQPTQCFINLVPRPVFDFENGNLLFSGRIV
jgi:hypothetical protein